jgi:hypothetical protein
MILADFHLPRPLRPAVAQAARVLCPAGKLDELGLVDYVVDYVELQLRAFPGLFRAGMVAGITTLELGAALRPGSLGTPFSRLAPDAAQAWFASFWASRVGPLRQLAHALKALVALAFYDSDKVRERLAYHPDAWIAERARARLERWGLDIQRHEEALLAPEPLLSAARLSRPRRRHA